MSTGVRIVIGIDLGTTYSAAAWALVSDPSHIDLIRNWPSAGQLVGIKVPTEIAYPVDGDDAGISWGYSISPRSRKIKWFKLGLETEDDVLSLPAGLSVIEVTRDYLVQLHGHIKLTLSRRFSSTMLETCQFEYVLTVPAIWSDAAKKRTEVAAINAGLGGQDSSLELLSEPESAAVYALRTIENVLSRIKIDDKIVVCDAGGGTVDLISYEIRRIQPTLKVVECTTGTGDFCGSSFIDREFDKLFSSRMGEAYSSLSLFHRQQALKNFETSKMAFRDEPNQKTFYINVPTLGDLPGAGVYGGNFEISRAEMKGLFDPVVEQVITLIRGQVVAASTSTSQINTILLVGGFGESEYLYKCVQSWAKSYNIEVLQPRDAATAVVQGAIIKGLEPKTGLERTQVTRRARRSYGVPTKEVFVSGKHIESDAEWDPISRQKLALNQVKWFIHANQVIGDEDVFRYRFDRPFKYLTSWEDSLVSSSSEAPPQRLESPIHKHCTIISDLTHLNVKSNFQKVRKGFSSYYTASYELVIGLKNNNLTIWLEYRGKRYGVADVHFETIS